MLDPITAFSVASAAFSAAKKLVETGREIEDVAGYFGKFFDGASVVKEHEKKASKPSVFKKFLDKGSVEQEALEATIQKQKIMQMEYELRQMVSMTYGEDVYIEMMRNRERIRQKRLRDELQARADMENAIAIGGIIALVAVIGYLVYLTISMALEAR